MNEAMNSGQAQACPQGGRGRGYFGLTDGGHGHYGRKDGKRRRHEGRGK